MDQSFHHSYWARLLLFLVFSTTLARAELKSTKVPRFDSAVARAVSFVQSLDPQKIEKQDIPIVAYSLLKAGVSTNDSRIVAGFERAKELSNEQFGSYHPAYEACVAALLLADIEKKNPQKYRAEIQKLYDRLVTFQQPDGSWYGSGSTPDTSLIQYCVLALWAADRAGCQLAPEIVDNAARFIISVVNSDGGWSYRPGTTQGADKGRSTHNMTLAAVGSLGILRLLLYGPEPDAENKIEKRFGILKKVEDPTGNRVGSFPDFTPSVTLAQFKTAIDGGLRWNQTRYQPVAKGEFPLYFYYTLERAAALTDPGENWYEKYGNGLLTLQVQDGHFKGHRREITPPVTTAFAILYFMRSTQQILDKQFGTGVMRGGRDLASLYGEEKKKKKDLGPLDALLAEMENADLSSLDDIDSDDFAEKITVTSREELVGQIDLLKKLVKHKDASNRQAAYYALGRTGDLSLIPEILKGLRDPNLDVNVEALNALRYISRKPNGFGIPLTPLAGAETADAERKLVVANVWRNKAWNAWAGWYRQVRPYDEGGGLDEVELLGRP